MHEFTQFLTKSSNIILLLVLVLVVLLIALPAFQIGMFLDGQQYAAIALNLAEENGSFWFPYLDENWERFGNTAFLEHPPLGYAMQALLFSVFGNGFFIEGIYSLTIFSLTVFAIFLIWKEVQTQENRFPWLTILLFISIETVHWSFRNNVLETTMALFDAFAIWLVIKARSKQNFSNQILNTALAGLFVLAAFFTKGLPGLFPLAAPFAFLIFGKPSKAIAMFAVLAIVVFTGFLAVFQSSEAASTSISFYLENRLIERITNAPTVGNRFAILGDLISQLLIPFGIGLFIYLFKKKEKQHFTPMEQKWMLFFLIIGLSASLPLLLTKVQRSFYLYPSYIFYALALGIWLNAYLKTSAWKLKPTLIKAVNTGLSIALVGGIVLTIAKAGEPSRDADLLHDVAMLNNYLVEDEVVKYEIADSYENYNWTFSMYVIRFTDFTLKVGTTNNTYCLVNEGINPPKNYRKIDLDLQRFELYQKIANKDN